MDRKELTEQLGRLVHESRALIDAADKRDADLVAQGKEARGFGAEEEQKYQRINDEITNVEGQIAAIDRRETQERREKFLNRASDALFEAKQLGRNRVHESAAG